ncbi:MAG TPA: chemotaxis protein CheA [Gemmatimonadaceae bacterium]|nr:chemotaxis protein CheA [Gemmatimonadaceae bacterium]
MTGDERFFEQFIDDYFAESEEHLASVRRVLLELDGFTGRMAPPAMIQALQRYLHTLKGLSGMVALASAERVAHAMEERARGLSEFRNVDGNIVQDLFEGAALLERCIAARRVNGESPPIEEYAARVGATSADFADGARTGAAMRPVLPVEMLFVFTPTTDVARRGIGVEVIRERLANIGAIIQASPRVLGEGRVIFEFLVSVRSAPPEEWRDDGLTWDASQFPREISSSLITTSPVGAPLSDGGTATAMSMQSTAVRVDLTRLDDIMRLVGDLVVSRSRIEEMLDGHGPAGSNQAQWDDLRDAASIMERQIRALREGVTRIRLVPIGEVFERMRFAMREIAREAGKAITLELHGQDTEIDKLVVDRMLEPLLHLVRNAASHGIEPADVRVARGKRAEGRIALKARAEGDRIFLEVVDDGGGINLEAVERRARSAGLIGANDTLPESSLLDVLCAPGFSTRAEANMASGRGVGMAVVRSAVRGLGGELSVQTSAGEGTRYTIELPLTLMIADALLFEVAGQSLAIPQLVLREIVELDPSQVRRIENNEVMPYREGVLPLVRLRRVFNLGVTGDPGRHVLVVGSDTNLTGLVVDRVIGLREIVVHSVTDPLIALPGIAGATELSNGRVSLIVDAAAIVRRGRDEGIRARTIAGGETPRRLEHQIVR